MEDYNHPSPAPLAGRIAAAVAAFVLCAAGVGYAVHEHSNAQALASQNEQMAAQLNATHSQLDALVSKVDTLAAKPAPADPAPVAKTGGKVTAAHRANPADPRFKKMQAQLDAQDQAIGETRSDLSDAQTALTGSIAKTHDELVTLEKKGERDYVEFDIQKSKDFKHAGGLSVSLRKADVRHQFADLQVIVDDRTLTQKHVNLYQPTMFYQPDSPLPAEIVVNSITKDHIHGYISAPKYKQSDLAATSDANGTDQATNAEPQHRQRLPLPSDNGPVQP